MGAVFPGFSPLENTIGGSRVVSSLKASSYGGWIIGASRAEYTPLGHEEYCEPCTVERNRVAIRSCRWTQRIKLFFNPCRDIDLIPSYRLFPQSLHHRSIPEFGLPPYCYRLATEGQTSVWAAHPQCSRSSRVHEPHHT